jgi:hypothetical protein
MVDNFDRWSWCRGFIKIMDGRWRGIIYGHAKKIVWLREIASGGCSYGEKPTSRGQYKFSRAEPHGSGSVLIFEVGYRGHPNGISVFLL